MAKKQSRKKKPPSRKKKAMPSPAATVAKVDRESSSAMEADQQALVDRLSLEIDEIQHKPPPSRSKLEAEAASGAKIPDDVRDAWLDLCVAQAMLDRAAEVMSRRRKILSTADIAFKTRMGKIMHVSPSTIDQDPDDPNQLTFADADEDEDGTVPDTSVIDAVGDRGIEEVPNLTPTMRASLRSAGIHNVRRLAEAVDGAALKSIDGIGPATVTKIEDAVRKYLDA